MVGNAKYGNSFTSMMVSCLENSGWRVEDFSYLRSLWGGSVLVINWPEHFGRYGRGRLSGSLVTPMVCILWMAKVLRNRAKVVLVHHNLPGQRFRLTLGTRILYRIADMHMSLGVSQRLTSALRRDAIEISHPAYSILTKAVDKKHAFLLVSDKMRSDSDFRIEGEAIYWSRDGLVHTSMMGKSKRIILGKLCELQLQTLISESQIFVIPWPTVLNSGLAVLSTQLGTQAVFIDQEYVREANANGLSVAYWDSNRQAVVKPSEGQKCRYSGITDVGQFNERNFCSPLLKALDSLRNE